MFVIIAIQGTLLAPLISRIEGGFYDTVLMSGATKLTFWMALYLKDVTVYMVFGIISFVIMQVFAKPCDGYAYLWT